MRYPISEIFRSLQGEGYFVGRPMTFVRLAGCSVRHCHIRNECDEAPWEIRNRLSVADVIDKCRRLCPRGIVCLTGGEPTDHDIMPLVLALRDSGFRLHLETSGVRSVSDRQFGWITVSPKDMNQELLIQRSGSALKIVIRPEWSFENAWHIVDGFEVAGNFLHRYLQPLTGEDGRPINLQRVIKLLHDERNADGRWGLSTQTHRFWGVE